jgi:Concanavalin A-like lectin/glucanases superfamily
MVRVRWAGFAALALTALGGCALLAGLPDVHQESTGGGGASGTMHASSSVSAGGASAGGASGGGGILASGSSGGGGSSSSAGGGACVSNYVATVMADSPIGYWRLGEMAGTNANAHAGPNGTYLHSPTLGVPGALACDANTSVHLDGVAACVTLGTSWSFVGRAPFSVEAWINPEALQDPTVDHSRIFNWELVDSGNKKQGWNLVFGTDGALFRRYENDVADVALGPVPPLGAWSHVAATYDGTTMTLYQDGAMTDSLASSKNVVDPATQLLIGAGYSAGSTANMKGAVDEAAVYDHALTAARVSAHYQAGIAP